MPKWLNKSAALIVCGALALVACSRDSPVVSTGRGGERGVAIPDAKLHAAIASALGKESNALITADEMATLTDLDAPNSGIRDLTGLEFATSLTRLHLGTDSAEGRFVNSNDISDLTPLAGLTNLTHLHLHRNSIADLTPLAGLTNLTRLSLSENSIADLTPLARLTNLTHLHLHRNSIADLTPLARLTNLTRLSLGENSIADLTPLARLTNLTTLWLWDNRVSDLTPLAGLTNLTTLWLWNNRVSDIAPLVGLTYLTTLQLGGNDVSDLTPIAGSTNLTTLRLYNNFVSDLTPLVGLTNLTALYLFGNRISNSDLTHLAGLTNLTTLQLGFNGISDLTPLAGLTNLTKLEIEDNAITDLTPIAELTNLITLQLNHNSISELPVGIFAGFANLKTLNLARNPGAPFAFTLELERTDAANQLAPSPADVAVQLAEGAPFEITVALSVHNGSASVASLTIGAGDTSSAPAHIAAISGSSTATHVVLDYAPQIPSGFTGVEVRIGSPLVLFAESDDHFPVAEGEIPPHILQVGGPKPTLDVTEYFSDADGDELVYSVSSNDGSLVGTRVNAGLLTLIPRAEGYTSVVVTATDSNGWSASQDLAVTVLPTPDPRSFDIDLVFVGPVTANTRSAALQAAKRWTEVITGDLPDVPVLDNSVLCMPVEQRFFGTIDDLVVFVAVESLTGASGHGGLCNWRADSSLPYMGYSVLDTELVARGREYVAGVTLHEIGHALGFGPLWHDFGFLQDSGGADPHFNGPLAIEAFDAAGGTNYTAGAKVPVSAGGGHWRFGGELMGAGGSALSAITVQSLADLGYVVDVSQADPFQLPSTAKAVADQGLDLCNDILQVPIRVADENGHIVRVIYP